MSHAIADYLGDMKAEGRITSAGSERAYYDLLALHAKDCGNRDPRTTGRDDVKRTLARWPNPNTQRVRRAMMISFYDWCMEEGHRKDNPARQTRRPKVRPTSVYRLQRGEAQAMMLAAREGVERRAIYLGLCAGLRRAELLGLQPRHFARAGYVWVSADIAKGGRERYIPVTVDLADVVAEIRAHVTGEEYVICGQQVGLQGMPPVEVRTQNPGRPMGPTAMFDLVRAVAERAGITGNVGPHTLRHAFCDHVARTTGDLRLAQSLMGHANVATTRGYTGTPTLDELTSGVLDVSYLRDARVPPETDPENTSRRPAAARTVDRIAPLPGDGTARTEHPHTEEEPHA